VWQLLHGGPDSSPGSGGMPWLDARFRPFEPMMDVLKSQTHRRSIKTHLPLDALAFSAKAQYLVVGRDARDIVWSAYNHQDSYTDEVLAALNSPAGRPGAPVSRPDRDIRDYYLHFLDHDDLPGFGFTPLWPHIQGWWNARRLPNVLLVHYANLKTDLEGEIRRIAKFLKVEIEEQVLPAIVEHCGFEYMRETASAAGGLANFRGGARTFFHKGVNGRWKDVLSPAEIARCDEVAARNLTTDCAHWLATGELPD
jgi:aryl sulfotransferase